jgi:hypothetical protein
MLRKFSIFNGQSDPIFSKVQPQESSRIRVAPRPQGASAHCACFVRHPHATHMLITTLTQETQNRKSPKIKNGAKNGVYYRE